MKEVVAGICFLVKLSFFSSVIVLEKKNICVLYGAPNIGKLKKGEIAKQIQVQKVIP